MIRNTTSSIRCKTNNSSVPHLKQSNSSDTMVPTSYPRYTSQSHPKSSNTLTTVNKKSAPTSDYYYTSEDDRSIQIETEDTGTTQDSYSLLTHIENTCTSPSAWIYGLGQGAIKPCFSGSDNTSIVSTKGRRRNSTSVIQNSRGNRQSKTTLSLSDDEIDESEEILSHIVALRKGKESNQLVAVSPDSTLTTSNSMRTVDSEYSHNHRRNNKLSKSKESTNNNEAKIIAPNVSKLPLHSIINVKLQSASESVIVQCAMDVLKMRSGYFLEILAQRDNKRQQGNTNVNESNSLVIIQEESPFEAAAFLESLHEGRSAFKGEWNICWARLSVLWNIEELTLEFANQIEVHTNHLLSTIQMNHWRTNPNVLAGMRVAVFRKIPQPTPSICIGLCVEASNNTGYSKIRVAFDADKSNINSNLQAFQIQPRSSHPSSPKAARKQGSNNWNHSLSITGGLSSPIAPNTNIGIKATNHDQSVFIGDIGEPFWVQSLRENSPWYDPDELFNLESKKLITSADKRIFWEMMKIIIELPQLATPCKTGIRSPRELCTVLRKPEYKILWTNDGHVCLPKDIANDLLVNAYIVPSLSNPILDKN